MLQVWLCGGGEGCWKDMKPNGEETDGKKTLNDEVSKIILDSDLHRFTEMFTVTCERFILTTATLRFITL